MIKKYENFNKPEVEEEWYDNGQKGVEIWRLNGKHHREDGAAYQWWYENGQKKYEIWSLNGNFHREDGSAYQYWNKKGQKFIEEWWINDKIYKRENWINKLDEIGSSHYEEQLSIYNAEKYNL